MGEAVISAGSGMEQPQKLENEESKASVVMWERFVPKMVVRVLLVEADDSTRQIIAALLRKCRYRVTAVTDGLQAWELLRGKPCSIDLILTEVDLPLISGYALLSLVMENEACKNIPVIMMSSHESVSTVYKCMLRGATDFLLKPVRINVLRNLWQHIWRKQAPSNAVGLSQPDESIGQKKDEAMAENSAVSDDNNSSRCVAKGSDAQSSCTKLESGNDGDEVVQHFTCLSQPEIHEENCHIDNPVEAIDLIGAFDNHLSVAVEASASNIYSKDAVPQLDLSLQRSRPLNHLQLNHSEASPFSRYINKPVTSTLMYKQQKGHEPVSSGYANYIREVHTSFTVQTGQAESTYSCCPNPKGGTSQPILVRGVRYENDSSTPPIFGVQEEKDSCLVPPDCLVQVHGLLDRRNSGSFDDKDRKSEQFGTENPVSVGKNQHGIGTPDRRSCSAAERGNEASYLAHDGVLQRSMQREAALMKFRLKRKERCFEKKVRYESRKKLAEQRPRVKGQFVRQVPTDHILYLGATTAHQLASQATT